MCRRGPSGALATAGSSGEGQERGWRGEQCCTERFRPNYAARSVITELALWATITRYLQAAEKAKGVFSGAKEFVSDVSVCH